MTELSTAMKAPDNYLVAVLAALHFAERADLLRSELETLRKDIADSASRVLEALEMDRAGDSGP